MTADGSHQDAPRVSPIPEGSRDGPLTPFAGAAPPAPAWFTRAIAQQGEQRSVAVHGTTIRYQVWGDAGKPGLLLAHGNGAHQHWWDFIAPFLAGDYHVAAMTLSGMGDSGWREHYSLEQFSDEQLAVCQDAGFFDAPVLPLIVGHSFGGFVTILTGARAADRLSGIVIVDSPVTPPDVDRGGPPRDARPTRVYPDLVKALARFRLAPPQDCENLYIVDYVARHSLREVEGGWTWKFDPGVWRRFEMDDMSARLRAMDSRIGIFYGQSSAIFPAKIGDYMFGLLGHAVPVVEIPEAQHHVMLDQPLAFIAALRALLTDWDHSSPASRGRR